MKLLGRRNGNASRSAVGDHPPCLGSAQTASGVAPGFGLFLIPIVATPYIQSVWSYSPLPSIQAKVRLVSASLFFVGRAVRTSLYSLDIGGPEARRNASLPAPLAVRATYPVWPFEPVALTRSAFRISAEVAVTTRSGSSVARCAPQVDRLLVVWNVRNRTFRS
jgi:hypothetical protein